MKRDKSYYRCQRKKHIQRKLGILRRTGGEDFVQGWSHGQSGRLSKGKIHCSCWMCRTKSYDEASRRDKRKCSAAKQQEAEFLDVLSQYDRSPKNRKENADTKVREEYAEGDPVGEDEQEEAEGIPRETAGIMVRPVPRDPDRPQREDL